MGENLTTWTRDWENITERCEFCGGIVAKGELIDGLCDECHEEINEIESVKTGWADLERLGYM